MVRVKKILFISVFSVSALFVVAVLAVGVLRAVYRRPYFSAVSESGLNPSLVYAVMKTESGFHADAVSSAGAVGLMQLLPATAEFICARENLSFQPEKLYEGEYNTKLGCKYLGYLLNRFSSTEVALCAYNAGEGTVANWLKNAEYSKDGETLTKIPYPETRAYVKKIARNRKIYEIIY